MTIDGVSGQVTVRYADEHGQQKVESEHLDLPPDVANGLIPSPLRTPTSNPPDFDLSPDGKRLLSTMPASAASGGEQSPGVTFLFNFADELRRKAPQR